MGMEFWLIPVLAMVVAAVAIFYMVIRHQGGSGTRGDGQTVVDKPSAEENRQVGWNYYK
jgi:cytochrome c-type biogenesis protein CcmH/NrfF